MSKGRRALIIRRLRRAHKHTRTIGSYLVWIMEEFKRIGRLEQLPESIRECAELCLRLDYKLTEAENSI